MIPIRALLLAATALLPTVAVAQLSFGSASLINDGWSFALKDVSEVANPEFDDRSWERVDLPHDWSVKQPLSPDLASCMGYLPGGIGWYRKTFSLPADAAGERVYIYFEGVYNRSDVYVNGHHLGHRPNGYVSFYYDVTSHVRPGAENVIAVRVDHSRAADSRWYTGSGIYRNVHLIRANPVHLAPWGIFARSEVDGADARLLVDAEVRNDSDSDATLTVTHELRAADGSVVASASREVAARSAQTDTVTAVLEVTNPRVWSVDSPNLYQLTTTLLQDGRTIDETTTRTGFRTFTFDPDRGFFLNGVPMKMKGVCLHHDAGVLGAAVPREVWRKRLQTLKSIGCNAIRTSHNPQAPDLYDLCDELGLLVLDEAFDEWEFPKRKWLEGWNVGTPGFEGSYDFFEEWGSRDLADMVRRDRNHPSIFAWSIGNEVDYPNDPYSHPVLDGSAISQPMFGGYKPDQPDANRLGVIARRFAAEVKQVDPSRPVTAGLAGVVMSNATGYADALDIAGYNYTENRYAIDHEAYPQRVIYGSENRHDHAAWKAVRDNDHIFGQFLWTGIDYLGESGPWPSRGFYSGLLDFGGFIKPRGHFRAALWLDTPVATLGTEPASDKTTKSMDAWPVWNYEPGQLIRVFAYTNAARAQLALNGKTIGDPKPYDDETGIIAWDIPFAPGRLEMIGFDESGAEICRSALQSAGPAKSMEVSAEETRIDHNKGLAMVVLQVVDDAGVPVMDSTHEVTCHIDGPARLLGLEASNNRDMSDYTDATHRVFHGRILAYVQATGTPGDITVRFTNNELGEGSIQLRAK